MEQKQAMHLCWNCDGQVPFNEPHCPYCGVELRYSDEANAEPEASYPQGGGLQEDWNAALSQSMDDEASLAKKEGVQGVLLPLLLLMSGGMFLFFSAMILLFAQGGELILRWSQGYWIFYASLGVPMLFIGWRYLKKLTP